MLNIKMVAKICIETKRLGCVLHWSRDHRKQKLFIINVVGHPLILVHK